MPSADASRRDPLSVTAASADVEIRKSLCAKTESLPIADHMDCNAKIENKFLNRAVINPLQSPSRKYILILAFSVVQDSLCT
jgi:hypothetical protein